MHSSSTYVNGIQFNLYIASLQQVISRCFRKEHFHIIVQPNPEIKCKIMFYFLHVIWYERRVFCSAKKYCIISNWIELKPYPGRLYKIKHWIVIQLIYVITSQWNIWFTPLVSTAVFWYNYANKYPHLFLCKYCTSVLVNTCPGCTFSACIERENTLCTCHKSITVSFSSIQK